MPLLTRRHALSGDRDLLQRLSSEEYYGFFWVQMALTDTETQQKSKPLFLTRIFSVREPALSQVPKLWTKPAAPFICFHIPTAGIMVCSIYLWCRNFERVASKLPGFQLLFNVSVSVVGRYQLTTARDVCVCVKASCLQADVAQYCQSTV